MSHRRSRSPAFVRRRPTKRVRAPLRWHRCDQQKCARPSRSGPSRCADRSKRSGGRCGRARAAPGAAWCCSKWALCRQKTGRRQRRTGLGTPRFGRPARRVRRCRHRWRQRSALWVAIRLAATAGVPRGRPRSPAAALRSLENCGSDPRFPASRGAQTRSHADSVRGCTAPTRPHFLHARATRRRALRTPAHRSHRSPPRRGRRC